MIEKVERERRAVTEALRGFPIAGPEDRYNLEYSTAEELHALTGISSNFTGTHYWFSSPVMEESFLRGLVNSGQKIMDVGAGNGALLQKICTLGVTPKNLTGVDISAQSVRRIEEIGAEGIHGTLALVKKGGWCDRVFLSYFIDRDEDQLGTIRLARYALRPDGLVVLEGLFPCVLSDSNGVSYGTANVTRGKDAEEDIGLVVSEFNQVGMTLQHRIDGKRFVYSMDGSETLPSCVLIFKKDRKVIADDIPNFH